MNSISLIGSQWTHFEHFDALVTTYPQETPRRLILGILAPCPPHAPRRPPEGSFWAFWCLGPHMPPGDPQKAHFGHFGACPPNAPRMLPEGSFWSFWCLGTHMPPGDPQKAHFKHFGALAPTCPQETPRRLILSILVPWPPNGPKRLPGDSKHT